jgi:hypothetical protein
MYLFEVGLVVAVVVGLVLSLAAYFLLARALWPRLVAGAEARFAGTPAICVVVGLPIAAAVLFGVTKLLGASLAVLGFPLGALALGFGLAGSAGIAARVGRALPSSLDAVQPVRAEVRGAAIVLLASLVPLIGWLLVFPVLVIGGLGAATIALFRPVRAETAQFSAFAR